jgi:hypothetical protein
MILQIFMIFLVVWSMIGILYVIETNGYKFVDDINNWFKKILAIFLFGPLMWLFCIAVYIILAITWFFDITANKRDRIGKWFLK